MATSVLTPPIHHATVRPRPFLAAGTLCWRELVRFFRQRNRVIGALGQPLIFWLLFGAGMQSSFRLDPAGAISYRDYFFPGTLVLIVLFTAIFSTISVIEDRREGFLQSVLVAPIPRWSMVLGKLLGGTLIALVQAIVFLALGAGLMVSMPMGLLGAVGAVVLLFVLGLALTALGFVIAWQTDSVQGFHAIMSVFLFPMWLLSGAFFPATDGWLGTVVRLNPLTYGVAGLRRLMYLNASEPLRTEALAGLPSDVTCVVVTLLFTVVMCALAWAVSARRSTADLV